MIVLLCNPKEDDAMTHSFDPTRIDQHLNRSARLRSKAILRSFSRLRSGVRNAARAVVAIWV